MPAEQSFGFVVVHRDSGEDRFLLVRQARTHLNINGSARGRNFELENEDEEEGDAKASSTDETRSGAEISPSSAARVSNGYFEMGSGNWSFPKGHSEGNETPLETARRELLEECGLSDISVIPKISFTEAPYTFTRDGVQKEKTNTFFLATTTSEILHPQPIEILECRFVGYDEARNLFTYEGQKRVLDEAKEYISKNL